MLPSKEKPVHPVDLELLWLNIGIDIIVDCAIQLLRWIHKLSKEMKKSLNKRKLNLKLRRKLQKRKQQTKLLLEREKKMLKKVKRNDWIKSYVIIYFCYFFVFKLL